MTFGASFEDKALPRSRVTRNDGPKNALPRGRSETNDELRFYKAHFRLEPWAAGCDLARVWFLMDSTLTSRLPFKMLHGVRHVNMAAIDSRFLQSAVHNFPRWSDKRPASDVFIIPRLFANQHNWRILGSLAEDSLRRVLVKVTCLAMLCRLAYR